MAEQVNNVFEVGYILFQLTYTKKWNVIKSIEIEYRQFKLKN